MIRAAIIAVLLFSVPAAWAQPADCVDPTAAWTKPYSQGTIQFITYYVWSKLFSVGYLSGEAHIHVAVPSAVANPFSSLTSADSRYNGAVKNVYGQAFLAETTCPLLNEDGTMLLGTQP
jgi:hypothetical protein